MRRGERDVEALGYVEGGSDPPPAPHSDTGDQSDLAEKALGQKHCISDAGERQCLENIQAARL